MIAEDHVERVREFNRFWTTKIGLLQAGLLDTPYSLTEARVIFELAQRASTELIDIRARLGLDAGYVSRIVARLREEDVVETTPSPQDARRIVLTLTGKGRQVFADLDRRSADQVAAMLAALGEGEERRLVTAMGTIEKVLTPVSGAEPYLIRPLLPGDLGWVVQRHGALYAAEYGWDQSFEALVARIVADYVDNHDPGRDNAWIAEIDGESVGCVFCVHGENDQTARLRILLVEPRARGRGIGARLVTECIRFARRAGYSKLTLWTNDVLVSARRIYEAAGFQLAHEAPHHSFGHDLVEQVWELDLTAT